MMKGGQFSKVLFITGFADHMPHSEIVQRFEEYGRVTSTRKNAPTNPDDFGWAFVEYAFSKDATAARSKLHHSVVHGCKLEVHFDTKIPTQFHPMLAEASHPGSPGARRSSSDMARSNSDYSAMGSPMSADFRAAGPAPERQAYAPRTGHAGRGPPPGAHYDSRRFQERGDGMRAPVRGRYGDFGGPQRARYGDERPAPLASARGRYATRTPGSFRAQGGRGYGSRAPRGGFHDNGGYRGRPQAVQRGAPYGDRDMREPDSYSHRSQSPPRKDYDSYRGEYRDPPMSAQGSWQEPDEAQLHTPRRSRSRSPSQERAAWNRSPSPVRENPIDDALDARPSDDVHDGAGFNEDSLFAAP